ncbi:hypothetical protein ABZ646_25890 [Streptomyces sp. NPDC007162]|uniref:hypothetical protein n=1 Tax=Streptomyces sp. NPDC007162 TaxID=3156917 RepID=UPI0033F477E4
MTTTVTPRSGAPMAEDPETSAAGSAADPVAPALSDLGPLARWPRPTWAIPADPEVERRMANIIEGFWVADH